MTQHDVVVRNRRPVAHSAQRGGGHLVISIHTRGHLSKIRPARILLLLSIYLIAVRPCKLSELQYGKAGMENALGNLKSVLTFGAKPRVA